MPKLRTARGREPVPAPSLFDRILADLPPSYEERLERLHDLNQESERLSGRATELQARVADAHAARTAVTVAEDALRAHLFAMEADGADPDGETKARLRTAYQEARARAVDVTADEAEIVTVNTAFRELQAQRHDARAAVIAAMGSHLTTALQARVAEVEAINRAIETLASWCVSSERVPLGIELRAGVRPPMPTEADPGIFDRWHAERAQHAATAAAAWTGWPDQLFSNPYSDPGNTPADQHGAA